MQNTFCGVIFSCCLLASEFLHINTLTSTWTCVLIIILKFSKSYFQSRLQIVPWISLWKAGRCVTENKPNFHGQSGNQIVMAFDKVIKSELGEENCRHQLKIIIKYSKRKRMFQQNHEMIRFLWYWTFLSPIRRHKLVNSYKKAWIWLLRWKSFTNFHDFSIFCTQ